MYPIVAQLVPSLVQRLNVSLQSMQGLSKENAERQMEIQALLEHSHDLISKSMAFESLTQRLRNLGVIAKKVPAE